ncbi:FtsH protease activity modulator HflK [Candidatus Hydrogenedentota bacterium]
MLKDARLKAASISIVCNIILVILKLWGARLSWSLALKADAYHSTSDVMVSIMVLAGILITKGNRQWLKRVENVVAMIISLLIMGAATSLLRTVIAGEYYAPERIPIAIGIVWICIIISYFIATYKIRVGRLHDSPSLTADGYHSKMDMFSSVAVFVGLLGNIIGLNLDVLASIVVTMLLYKVGVEIMAASVQGLIASDVFTFQTFAYFRTTPAGRKLMSVYDTFLAKIVVGIFSPAWNLAGAIWRRRRKMAFCAGLLLVVGYAASGLYQIAPDEVGVVLQCGKLRHDNVQPGLHYHLPWPVSKLHKVRVDAVRQLEFGYRTIAARGEVVEPAAYLWESMHSTGLYRKVEEESIMLTGDANEVDLNLIIEYQVLEGSAANFLFNIANSELLIRSATEEVMRSTVSVMSLEDVLTTGRDDIEKRAFVKLGKLLDQHNCGVRLTAIHLQDVHPPVAVVPSFRNVVTAREERNTVISRAIAYQKDTLPRARGEADQTISDAKAYLAEKELEAAGESAYFTKQLKAYRKTPGIIAFNMYMDALDKSLPRTRKIVFDERIRRAARRGNLGNLFLVSEFLKEAGILGDGQMSSEWYEEDY